MGKKWYDQYLRWLNMQTYMSTHTPTCECVCKCVSNTFQLGVCYDVTFYCFYLVGSPFNWTTFPVNSSLMWFQMMGAIHEICKSFKKNWRKDQFYIQKAGTGALAPWHFTGILLMCWVTWYARLPWKTHSSSQPAGLSQQILHILGQMQDQVLWHNTTDSPSGHLYYQGGRE